MTERTPVGWRTPVRSWARLERHTRQKHGEREAYIRFELEEAMREYLDEDEVLHRAEKLLRTHTDLRGLSSSTTPSGTDEYADAETKKVMYRVNPRLLERFRGFAKEHDISAYGRLLARAIDSYVDGGRARRLLDDVRRLITGSDRDTTHATIENSGGEADPTAAAGEADDGPVSTDGSGGITHTPDAETVVEVAATLPEDIIPKKLLKREIAKASEPPMDMDAYCEAVLDEIGASAHPHNETVYITDEYRKNALLWADMDKAERIVFLRRFAAKDAIERRKPKQGYSYSDVQRLFEEETCEGPSHQYAYDLMEAAADVDGFEYGKFRDKKQLRVNLNAVSDAVLEWAFEQSGVDPEELGGRGAARSTTSDTTRDTHAVADGGTVEDDADDVDAEVDRLERAERVTNPGGEAD